MRDGDACRHPCRGAASGVPCSGGALAGAREPPAIHQHTSGVPQALVIEASPTSAADIRCKTSMTVSFFISKHPCFSSKHPSFISKHACLVLGHASFISKHACFVLKHASFISKHACFALKHPSFISKHVCFVLKHPSFISKHACFVLKHA